MIDITTTPLVYVDVETTGFDPKKCRMIEVAAIRREHGKETGRVVSLLELNEELPEIITKITSITQTDLLDQPQFVSIAPELLEILDGAVFVAHNAKFDYSFFKAEFARLDEPFNMPALCTVELARHYYPDMPNHKLQTLIEHFGFGFEERHRAYDDAAVLIQFMHKLAQEFGIEDVAKQADRLHFPALPSSEKTTSLTDIEAAPYPPARR